MLNLDKLKAKSSATMFEVKEFLVVNFFQILMLVCLSVLVVLLFKLGQVNWQNEQLNHTLDRRTRELLATQGELDTLSASIQEQQRQTAFLCAWPAPGNH